MIPEEPDTAVDIHCEDDGSIELVFGGGVSAADLAAGFASLPADAWVASISTEWHSERNDCEGQDFPDEAHVHPVTSMLLMLAELPSEVTS